MTIDVLPVTGNLDNTNKINYYQVGNFLFQFGRLYIDISKTGNIVSNTITFLKEFKTVPSIVLTPISTVPGTGELETTINSRSTTNFTAITNRITKGTTQGVDWLAIGKAK